MSRNPDGHQVEGRTNPRGGTEVPWHPARFNRGRGATRGRGASRLAGTSRGCAARVAQQPERRIFSTLETVSGLADALGDDAAGPVGGLGGLLVVLGVGVDLPGVEPAQA